MNDEFYFFVIILEYHSRVSKVSFELVELYAVVCLPKSVEILIS